MSSGKSIGSNANTTAAGPSKVSTSGAGTIDKEIRVGNPIQSDPPSAKPSILGILASRRFARQFASRMYARRTEPSSSNSRCDVGYVGATYRMTPKVLFTNRLVGDVMEEVVNARMSGFQYTPDGAASMTKRLTEEIRDRVKELNFDRYKIVCVVSIGQTSGQGLRITSRCTWDVTYDNHCTYTWTNGTVFCTATVYGLYHE